MKTFQIKPVETLRRLGLALTLTFGLVAIIASGGGGGSDDSGDNTNTSYDLSGVWTFTMESVLVSGPCPPNPPVEKGTATISQSGTSFSLTFGGGADCNPPSACVFNDGVVSGALYTISNSGAADNEGGTFSNTLTFTAISAKLAKGGTTSDYIHPDGQCHWTGNLTLSR
jgi:hypothetical protein